MGQLGTIHGYFKRKLQVLEKIAANTETQFRFIRKGEMKGLGRVIEERDELLQELDRVNKALLQDERWKKEEAFTVIRQEIAHNEQEVQVRSYQVLQEAIAERLHIAAELRKRKVHRQVQKQYVNPWAIMERGGRINAIG